MKTATTNEITKHGDGEHYSVQEFNAHRNGEINPSIIKKMLETNKGLFEPERNFIYSITKVIFNKNVSRHSGGSAADYAFSVSMSVQLDHIFKEIAKFLEENRYSHKDADALYKELRHLYFYKLSRLEECTKSFADYYDIGFVDWNNLALLSPRFASYLGDLADKTMDIIETSINDCNAEIEMNRAERYERLSAAIWNGVIQFNVKDGDVYMQVHTKDGSTPLLTKKMAIKENEGAYIGTTMDKFKKLPFHSITNRIEDFIDGCYKTQPETPITDEALEAIDIEASNPSGLYVTADTDIEAAYGLHDVWNDKESTEDAEE